MYIKNRFFNMENKTLKKRRIKLILLCISLGLFTQNAFSEIVIKWKNDGGWANMYLHAWDSDGNIFSESWPGKQMTADSDGWYSYTFSQSSVNFLFNGGGDQAKSPDITNVTSSTCYNGATGAPVTCPSDPIIDPDYGGGSGTNGDPYIISEKTHLSDLSAAEGDWGKVFSVTATINMSGATFTSIGTATKPFTGTFNGNSKEISNLSAKNGLFAYTKNATISNVALTSVAISGADTQVGGLIGYAESTNVQNSYVTGQVQSNNGLTGGFIGVSKGSTIDKCFSRAAVSVTTGICVGGFIGEASSSSSIKNSYATGNVTGTSVAAIGGFIGKNEGSSVVENCYATGNVTSSKNYAGGFAGANYATIKNSAGATAEVSSEESYVAAFGGNNNSRNTSTDNITWNGTTLSAPAGYGDEGNASGENDFLTQSTFSNKGWIFPATWTFDAEKYPRLTDLANQAYPYPFGDVISGIDDPAAKASISLYPNPFEDQFTIDGIAGIQAVTLYNGVGMSIPCTVAITEGGAVISNLSSLTSGAYFVRIITADGQSNALKALKK